MHVAVGITLLGLLTIITARVVHGRHSWQRQRGRLARPAWHGNERGLRGRHADRLTRFATLPLASRFRY